MRYGSSKNKLKSILAPTEIKNSPSKSPLKGSISVSNSCLYSLSASTTPARKVPNAADSPTSCIASAIPITRNRANAVKTSLSLVSAIKRNT